MTVKQIIKKSLRTIREGHEENLPTHASGTGAQIPDKLPAQASAGKDASASLPTHASDAAVEIPDTIKAGAGKSAAKEVDGQAAADNSAQHGNAQGSFIPDHLKEEDKKEDDKKEEKEEDLKEEDKKEDWEAEDKKKDEEEMKEHLSALVRGELLPEEFKTKAATLFETAVASTSQRRIEREKARLQESFEKKLNEEKEGIYESLIDKVDTYLDYVVEEWIKENQVGIDQGLKAEITERFLVSLKGLFEANYIEIPEVKYDIVEDLNKKNEDLEQKLNEEINRGVELKKQLAAIHKDKVIAQFSEGLTDVQAAKFKKLCEGVSFDSAENFGQKLTLIKENYFPNTEAPAPATETISEVVDGGISQGDIKEEAKTADPMVQATVDKLSRLFKN